MARESAKQESGKLAAKAKTMRITLAIRDAPSGIVSRSEVVSEMTISATERDGIAQDGTAGRVSYIMMSTRLILTVLTTTHRGRDQHLQPQALAPQPADPHKAQDD